MKSQRNEAKMPIKTSISREEMKICHVLV